MSDAAREIRRVRHEARMRRLTVERVRSLTPKMLRISVGGEELAGFTSQGFDDHVRLFFPTPGGELALPVMGPNGATYPEGVAKPEMRDYTPRAYDERQGLLHIDFVIHDAGPATTWAAQARPGQSLGVGGPRGSAIIPMNFDWHLLVGDETALPAIQRRMEELAASARAITVIEVEDASEQQEIASAARVDVHWVHRDGEAPGSAERILKALQSVAFPSGDYFAWAAAESNVARAIRKFLLDERGASKQWVKAAGYWRRGNVGAHEPIQD
jgi:NADPH-dependent ferric siderophore reductase